MGRRAVVDEATIEIELYGTDHVDVARGVDVMWPAHGGERPPLIELAGMRRRWSRALVPRHRIDGVSTVRRVVAGASGHAASALVGVIGRSPGQLSGPSIEVGTGWLAIAGAPRHEPRRREVCVPGVLHRRYGVLGVRVELVVGEWSVARSELRLEVRRRWRSRRRLPSGYFDVAHDVLDRMREEIELRLA